MLWLGGFLSLDLMTGTPDALCPPLEEARAAVKARVGEVKGDYHAEFSLVRADDGHSRLDLTLREGVKEVLRRELPIDTADCQDAAQTIALVLERYFDAIERPVVTRTESAPRSAGEKEAGAVTSQPQPPVPSLSSTERPARATTPIPWGTLARAGALVDQELGVAAVVGASFYPQLLRLAPQWRLGFGVEVAPFFARQGEVYRDAQIDAFVLQGAALMPLERSWSRWRASLGPWAQLRFQRASITRRESEDSAFRAISGVGGFVRVGLDLTDNVGLGAGLAAGWQLSEAAPRFVLEGTAGQIAVLVPDAWFGHGQLTIELKL
jgi:hypothetical protein